MVEQRTTWKKRSILQIYLGLSAAVSLFTILRLFLIPADPKNAALWGLSPARWALIGFSTLLFVLFSILALDSILNRTFAKKLLAYITTVLCEGFLARRSTAFAAAIGLLSIMALRLIPIWAWKESADQITRLYPIFDLLFLLTLLYLIFTYVWRGKKIEWKNIRFWEMEIKYGVIAVIVFTVLVVVIGVTHLGTTPDRSGWYAPGTPILISQVIFAIIIAFACFAISRKLTERIPSLSRKGEYLDIVLCGLLWITAFMVWWSEPMKDASYFAPEPSPPNFEYYPYSDGAEYDGYAQDLIIGKGDDMGLIRRPLYAYFLAGLHLLVGQDYDWILGAQTAVLAVIPALIYALVLQLGNRIAGLATAILVILREDNAIRLTNVIEVSHSKLLLSELPTMALMLLLCILLVRWLQNPDRRWHHAVFAGGVLGLLAMIRSQSILLAPVVLAASAALLLPDWRKLTKGLLLISLGLFVTIAPWIMRSHSISGKYVIEDTYKYIDLLASGYTFTPYESIAPIPGETRNDHYDRMVKLIIDFVKMHPDEVAHFYLAHFFHNEISKVVYLPMTFYLYDLRSYISQMHIWKDPAFPLIPGISAIIFINLGLISLGLGTAYRKIGVLALIPILLTVAYSFSTVPARLSSGRFILPIDWISLIFYSMGIIQLIIMAHAIYSGGLTHPQSHEENTEIIFNRNNKDWGLISSSSALFLILGLGFALIPEWIPTRYPALKPEEIIFKHLPVNLKLDNGLTTSLQEIRDFLDRGENGMVYFGRDLYPRYYQAGDYWGDENIFNLEARKVNRLQFILIGPQNGWVILPLKSPPELFPQAADVLIVGCQYDYGIRAIFILVNDQQPALATEPWSGLACSASTPQ